MGVDGAWAIVQEAKWLLVLVVVVVGGGVGVVGVMSFHTQLVDHYDLRNDRSTMRVLIYSLTLSHTETHR